PSTTLIPTLLDFSSLFGFDHRVSILEKELSQLKQVDHSAQILTSIRSQIPAMVDDHLSIRIQKSKSYQAAPEHKELYDAFVKSYKLDKDLFKSYGNTYSLNRDRDDKDKDEDPSAGSDRVLKKRKTSKDVEPIKGLKTKELKSNSSKGTKSQLKSSRKFVQAHEPEFEIADSYMPQNQEGNLGNDDKEPMREVASKRPAFKLLKGIHTNFYELKYDFEECYKALSEKLDWDNLEGGDYPFDLIPPFSHEWESSNSDFPRLRIDEIEDMLLLVVQNTLTNLSGDDVSDFAIALRMFTRSMVIQKRVRDLQMGVKSYQKKINITKP
ncbi:hypothetical protein Tco_1339476, partial [Tanacetum coccineum]